MKLFFVLLLALFTMIDKYAIAEHVHIIPEPYHVVEKLGNFQCNGSTKIIIDTENPEIIRIVNAFSHQFELASGIRLHVDKRNNNSDTINAIIVELKGDPQLKNAEGYILDISDKRIKIAAPALAGLFYAFESLKQLLPADFYFASKRNTATHWNIPCAYIIDYPQYAYRGMNLDVSRHFFLASFIKHYLDILASYKINIFHWHLTDSHGWRLEIKQYPRLTSVGAWRADRKNISMTIAEPTGKNEPATYGGFYTQEEVKEIIQYAKERFITIIPEIEMPGHCTAALVAYPQYNCLNNKSPLLIPCGYPGDLEHNFCAGNDSTYIFLNNILTEVTQLFPSTLIHIGGDEVRGGPWLNCPRCLKLMKENGFTTAKQVQAYFTKRIDSFITANGKKIIGWEEILLANVSHQSIAMAWHGNAGAVESIKKGYDVVMTPYHYTYFDFYQSDPGLEDYITYAPLFLDTVYAFNPVPPGLTAAEEKHILGGEASLWTENVETPQRVEYMLLPRLLAFAEVLWSPPAKKNYAAFINKTEEAFKRFDAQYITYGKSMYNVSINPMFDTISKKITVRLNSQAAGKYKIHYTKDGTKPGNNSPVYHQSLVLNKSINLQTALIVKGRILGKINKDIFTVHKAIGSSIHTNPTPIDEETGTAYKHLVDGIYGTIEPYDGRWVSLYDSVKTIIIDLMREQTIHSVGIRFMEDQVGNIYLPKKIEIAASPGDKDFKNIYEVFNATIPQQKLRHIAKYKKEQLNIKARFIKITISNANLFSGDPQKNILLLDEIVVQ